MKPHRIVVDVSTGEKRFVEWTDSEWAEIQARGAQIDAEEAARPKLPTLEERVTALELSIGQR